MRRRKLLTKAELNAWLGGLIRRGVASRSPRQQAIGLAAAEVLGVVMGWLHGSAIDLADSTLYSRIQIDELLEKLARDMK